MHNPPLNPAEGPNPGADQVATTSVDSGFLPQSPPRASIESVVVRVVATGGVIGIGTALGAILAASNLAGWILGLVISTISVILAALLWRSRTL